MQGVGNNSLSIEGKKDMKLQREAVAFFYKFVMADCDKIAIENPVRSHEQLF